MYSNNILMIIQVLLCLGYSILLIFIFNSVIKFIKKECEIKAKEQEYEDFKEYTRNLESIYKEMRGFRHDYVNILSSINIYIEEKNLEGLRTYFNNNILKMSNELTTRDYKIACLQNIKIPEIKGIISSKIIRAQEMGIDIDVEVLEEIEEFNINTIHLCRILGILLDNAIEEVIHCEFKKIRFAIIKKMDKVIIVVINNCRKSVPPIHKILKEGFSTKGNERGIGLSNLKSILSNYPKAIIETKVTDNE
ncbi:MAG: sensor histidine kinase, partial [Clostridium sp.]